jgi:tRNA A-37 threonylcarbamoyl transferase component Bud32
VNTPLVAAARVRSAPGWGWRLEIVTRRVEGTVDLDEVLAAARSGGIDRAALRRIVVGAGSVVRALHDAGCHHADLTTKNLLVGRAGLSGGEPKLWVLDLDRARIGSDLSQEDRRQNLARLYRYVGRRERALGSALARTDWMRFLRGYERDRRRRRELARAVRASHTASLPWHALGWKLEEFFDER